MRGMREKENNHGKMKIERIKKKLWGDEDRVWILMEERERERQRESMEK